MIWEVADDGRMTVRIRAEGMAAVNDVRAEAGRFVANMVGDLSVTMGIDVVTNEMRFSISKTEPDVTVTWRAQVPAQTVPDVREYLTRLSQSMDPVRGEVVSRGDDVPDQ
jgi:hypothetical protein